jgi:hypothetical protein
LFLKRIAAAVAGTISGFLGLPFVLNFLYNLCGLFGGQDCATGSKWESELAVLVCAALASGAFFLSYRLFRFSAAR